MSNNFIRIKIMIYSNLNYSVFYYLYFVNMNYLKKRICSKVIYPILNYYSCACMHAKSFQLCLTLCNPLDHSPLGSSAHGILYARILEWVAMPSSRGSSWPREGTQVTCFSCIDRRALYHYCHLGSPLVFIRTINFSIWLFENTK